jgi:hypothetical protein
VAKAYVSVFHLQKAGNLPSEYEDAFWPLESCDKDLPLRIAAADGATDAVFSGLWANILVRSWGLQHFTTHNFAQEVAKKGMIWRRLIRRRQVPWYVEEKARFGTFAALIGVEVCHAGTWTAVACGDCCIFQIRDQDLIAAFPVSRSGDFSNSPVLLTTGNTEDHTGEAIRSESGSWEPGDHLYLMTDALACWFLSKHEAGRLPWEVLTEVALTRSPSFSNWITDLRKRKEIKNDDCTLVSVTLE